MLQGYRIPPGKRRAGQQADRFGEEARKEYDRNERGLQDRHVSSGETVVPGSRCREYRRRRSNQPSSYGLGRTTPTSEVDRVFQTVEMELAVEIQGQHSSGNDPVDLRVCQQIRRRDTR